MTQTSKNSSTSRSKYPGYWKIGDVQGFDLAVLKVNNTSSSPSLNLMTLYGEKEKKLGVKIYAYYLFGGE